VERGKNPPTRVVTPPSRRRALSAESSGMGVPYFFMGIKVFPHGSLQAHDESFYAI
jgi:hypothetical protein